MSGYKLFTIYDSDGNIVETGGMPEHSFHLKPVPPGLFLLEEDSDPNSDTVDVITKKVIRGGKQKPQPNYKDAREDLYPSVAEQMDMLWHSMDTGQIPKAEPFYTTIKNIKQAYPKDNSVPYGSVQVINI